MTQKIERHFGWGRLSTKVGVRARDPAEARHPFLAAPLCVSERGGFEPASWLWLFRRDEHAQERFPSLFSAARPTGGKAKRAPSNEADEVSPEVEGAETSDAAAPA